MNPYILTPRAAQDVVTSGITSLTAVSKLPTVFWAAIEKAMNRLAKHPGTGNMREELADRRHRLLLVTRI